MSCGRSTLAAQCGGFSDALSRAIGRSLQLYWQVRKYPPSSSFNSRTKRLEFALLRPYPPWLTYWLWISYGVLFVGEIQSWWVPYFFGSKPEKAARFRATFGATHSFLPERHGIVPNSLHSALHLATLATLVALGLRVG